MKPFHPTPEFDARFRELYEAGASPRRIRSDLKIDKPIFIATKRRLDLHRSLENLRRSWSEAENHEFVLRYERGDSPSKMASVFGRSFASLSSKASLLGLSHDPTRFERLEELTRRLASGERLIRIADEMEVAHDYLDAVVALHGLDVRFRSLRPGAARNTAGYLARWTLERDEELSRLHAAGSTVSAIARALGVGHSSVNRRLIVLGLVVDPRFPNRVPDLVSADASTSGATETMKASVATTTTPEIVWTERQDDRIAKLFAVGVKQEEIAKDLGRGVALVRDRIAALGLKRGSLERHPSTIVALSGVTPAAPKQDVLIVDREAITAFTRDADGFEVTAAAHGIDVDRRFKAAEVKGIDDAIDRTVAALRALVVSDRITAGAPCDPEDVRTALAAAQEAGRVSDALVLAAWKAGVVTVDGRARRRPVPAAKGTRPIRFTWTPEQDAQLRNLWVKGSPRREISEKLGIPMTTVRDRTIKLKLPTRAWDAAAGVSRVTA